MGKDLKKRETADFVIGHKICGFMVRYIERRKGIPLGRLRISFSAMSLVLLV